jgi:ATP-dependent DNA helicase RecQ
MLQLRPFQKEALDALENPLKIQNHILCIAPTGSGKSLIYEKAASQPKTRTLLITPLVALARQQFHRLKNTGIPVTLGAGDLSQGPPQGETGAWIVSPETLSFPSRKATLARWKPNFLVVDECHCLWEWGETFRPAFNLIPELIKSHSICKSLWLTATLPYEARLHLRKLLPEPPTELGSFGIPKKLELGIHRVSWKNRTSALLEWVQKQKTAGIVFVPTRESTLRISRLLLASGKKAIPYHGGMSAEERKNIENQVSQKIPDVIIATSAFGMGMDYPHLNYVILWQAPTSILSLVQTIGRVGRNNQTHGQAIVFWDHEDFKMLEWTIQNSEKRKAELSDLFKFLQSMGCRKAWLEYYFDQASSTKKCTQCDFCN